MLIIHVRIHVKPEFLNQFIEATIDNAKNSLLEPGITRFDVLQDKSDPNRFILNEIYRDTEAHSQHKTTAHYFKWRDTVNDMMAEYRSSVQLTNIFPADDAF